MQAQPGVEGGQIAFIFIRIESELIPFLRHRCVAADGSQVPAQKRHIPGGGDTFGQFAFELVAVFVKGFQIAVLGQKFHGRLFPHPSHTGDIVGAVAHQSFEIGKMGRGHTVTLPYCGLVDAFDIADALAGPKDRCIVVHQLEDIPVAGIDINLEPLGGAAASQSAQQIVSFEIVHFQPAYACGVQHLLDQFELASELDRSFGTGAFIFCKHTIAEGMTAFIEADRQIIGGFFGYHPVEHHHKTVNGVGEHAVLVGKQRQREKSPVQQAAAVDKKQFSHNGSLRVPV